MFDIVSWRKKENFHKKIFDCFVDEVAFKRRRFNLSIEQSTRANIMPEKSNDMVARKKSSWLGEANMLQYLR